jgi:hypothetical protein
LTCSSSRPAHLRTEGTDGRLLFRLETEDGAAADPARFETSEPSWRAGDSIYFGKRMLRMIGKRDDDADRPPVLLGDEAQV